MDLMEPVLDWLLGEGHAQFVVLGTGAPEYHAMFEAVQARYPKAMRAFLSFDEALARRIYAGADMLLMPSAVEPCGLGQLIAMRYGCVPVVRAVGGLYDTVVDHTTSKQNGTGFTFKNLSMRGCKGALQRALKAHAHPETWRGLQERGMARDSSWSASARAYARLYQEAIAWHGE
jgi:starch synthase